MSNRPPSSSASGSEASGSEASGSEASGSASSGSSERRRRRSRYERTKQDFSEMNTEEQASFLIEATASVLAQGLEEAGRRVAEELEALFRRSGRPSPRDRGEDARPGAAEPETSQRTAPR
jgi:hypothetical protein